MKERLFGFNFDRCRFIPADLFDKVWKALNEMGQSFWGSEIHERLEDYLDIEVTEIHTM